MCPAALELTLWPHDGSICETEHKSLQSSETLQPEGLTAALIFPRDPRAWARSTNRGFPPTRRLINRGMILFTNPIKCHLQDGHVVAVWEQMARCTGQAMPPRCRNYIVLMGCGRGPKWPTLDSPSRAAVSVWEIGIDDTRTGSKGKSTEWEGQQHDHLDCSFFIFFLQQSLEWNNWSHCNRMSCRPGQSRMWGKR